MLHIVSLENKEYLKKNSLEFIFQSKKAPNTKKSII